MGGANGVGFFMTTSAGKPMYRLMGCKLFERCCARCCHLPCCLAAANKVNHCVNRCELCRQQMNESLHSMKSMPSRDEQKCSEFVKHPTVELEVAGTVPKATNDEVEAKIEEKDGHDVELVFHSEDEHAVSATKK